MYVYNTKQNERQLQTQDVYQSGLTDRYTGKHTDMNTCIKHTLLLSNREF